jgi:hypothetical protein
MRLVIGETMQPENRSPEELVSAVAGLVAQLELALMRNAATVALREEAIALLTSVGQSMRDSMWPTPLRLEFKSWNEQLIRCCSEIIRRGELKILSECNRQVTNLAFLNGLTREERIQGIHGCIDTVSDLSELREHERGKAVEWYRRMLDEVCGRVD